MKIRTAAAWLVAGAALPVLADVASDPYSTRGVVRSWWCGAVKLAIAATVRWALYELAGQHEPPDTGRPEQVGGV